MSKENKTENSIVITLKFKSILSKDRKGEIIYEKKEEDGKIVDDTDNIVYDRNDIVACSSLFAAIDVLKLSLQEERQLLLILEKLQLRWLQEDWECEIEFSIKEIAFIQKYFADIRALIRKGIVLTQSHSKTKIALLDQLGSD